MKNIVFLSLFVLFGFILMAQTPPHPGGGSGNPPGSGEPPVGAPIDGSVAILLTLALGYTGKKIYNAKKRKKGAVEPLFSTEQAMK